MSNTVAEMQDRLDLIGSVAEFNEWNKEMSSWCRIKCQPYDRNLHKSDKIKKIISTDKITRNERRRIVQLERKKEHLKRKKILKKEQNAKKRQLLQGESL